MTAHARPDDNLRVRCPRCGNEGEVPRAAAGQIWGCTNCRRWVYIDRRGRAHARVRLPDPRLVSVTVDVRCPGCGAKSRVSPRQLERLLVCPTCTERIWVAPDGRLLSGRAAVVEYRRTRSMDSGVPRGALGNPARAAPARSRLHWAAFLTAGGLFTATLLAVTLARMPLSTGPPEVERVAAAFVDAFLQGDKDAAASYIDPGATDSFERWWLLHRAVLEAAFGRSVRAEVTAAEVERMDNASAEVCVRVRVRSRELQYILSLVRRGTRWLVRPATPRPSEPATAEVLQQLSRKCNGLPS